MPMPPSGAFSPVMCKCAPNTIFRCPGSVSSRWGQNHRLFQVSLLNAIPVEAHTPVAEAAFSICRWQHIPAGVVKVNILGMGQNVVGAVGCAGWPQVGANFDKINFLDSGVAVPPLTLDQLHTGVRLQVN